MLSHIDSVKFPGWVTGVLNTQGKKNSVLEGEPEALVLLVCGGNTSGQFDLKQVLDQLIQFGRQ